jgi:hypothetical protein
VIADQAPIRPSLSMIPEGRPNAGACWVCGGRDWWDPSLAWGGYPALVCARCHPSPGRCIALPPVIALSPLLGREP